jgi:hypothetical protein
LSKFSTHCFRDFKRFIGELTATSAGVNVAIQYTNKAGIEAGADDPWALIAKEFGIKVDGLQSARVLSSAARLNIVNVYSGFDLYLTAYRKEFVHLFKKDWISDKSDAPFDEFRKNIALNDIEASLDIITPQLKLIDFYRLARNGIVHPSKENKQTVVNFFKKEATTLKKIQNHYKMLSAPNDFELLDFHDIKLFCRTLLDILPLFDEKLDPGNERLKATVPIEEWKNYKDDRRRNAEIGFLQNRYGISRERSEEILAH